LGIEYHKTEPGVSMVRRRLAIIQWPKKHYSHNPQYAASLKSRRT
jgi:hypothetical protein